MYEYLLERLAFTVLITKVDISGSNVAALQHSEKSGQSNLKQIFMRKLLTQVKKNSHSEWMCMWGCICFWPVKALEIEIYQNKMHLNPLHFN